MLITSLWWICAAMFAGCAGPSLIPAAGPLPPPADCSTQVVRFPGGDGITLEGRLFAPRHAEGRTPLPDQFRDVTVLFCHGVADTAESQMADIFREAGWRVFAFDYRGFGNSDGGPFTNQALAADAVAALNVLRSREDVNPDRVLLYGHSMGGVYAMACAAAAHAQGRPVAGVIAGSPFSRWRDVANDLVPVVGWLFGGSDPPEPVQYAEALGATPLLLLHAADDHDVPPYHSLRLFAAARARRVPVTLHITATGGHVWAYQPGGEIDAVIDRWLQRVLRPTKGATGLPPGRSRSQQRSPGA
ncbi:MAG: alpha/beta hydrolase [Planctomycetaceae bacterium]|nr:alpha/beta fold hydrolase [Phycisphaerales bacterium]MCE2652155.1 alpha/beta hydrolase [Planctomycetaceae bacterium]